MINNSDYRGTVSRGVKFIKISRFDSEGIDRSAYLEQLTSLSIVYDDIGPVVYRVTTTQEQSNSYLFGVNTQPLTSSLTNPLGFAYTLDALTIFNPDFLNFEYNDYNPLLGNAETPQFSSQFLDIDYGAGINTPINFGLILSGTADPAQVQDSNYSSAAWSNIRYNGSRQSSRDFNKPF
jgi:hypothetical protein